MKLLGYTILLILFASASADAQEPCKINNKAIEKDLLLNPEYISLVMMHARSYYCKRENIDKWKLKIAAIEREWINKHFDEQKCSPNVEDAIDFQNFLASYKLGVGLGQQSSLSILDDSAIKSFCK